jgi:two-component system chemotaxis response regulator CheY
MPHHALVVDDSKAMRMILSRILAELGFDAAQAGNGVEAMAYLESCPPEQRPVVALVDWNMPEMNGLELIRAIRANDDFTRMCVVMVTTETEMSQMAKALAAGANEYVMKPFTSEVIASKLDLLWLPVRT